MGLRHRLKNWSNPHNLTRLHLKRLSLKYGFTIGEHTFGNPKVRFAESGAKLTIGRYGSIADQVEIMLGGNHRTDWVSTFPFGVLSGEWPEAQETPYTAVTNGDVNIGHDVWLGTGCMILSGITIGNGAVVAARAMVTRDVPPYAIVAGNPAKIIRYRFDGVTIARLLATNWWDLPRARVLELVPLLQSGDTETFLRVVEAR